MHILETRGELDRAVEYLPDEMELADAAGARRRSRGPARGAARLCQLSLDQDSSSRASPIDPYLARELGPLFPKAWGEIPDAI